MVLENVTIVEDGKTVNCFRGQLVTGAADIILDVNQDDRKIFKSLRRDGRFTIREENLTSLINILNYYDNLEYTAWEIGGGKVGHNVIMHEVRDHYGDLLKSWTEEVPA